MVRLQNLTQGTHRSKGPKAFFFMFLEEGTRVPSLDGEAFYSFLEFVP
jgi:hypothetical protein